MVKKQEIPDDLVRVDLGERSYEILVSCGVCAEPTRAAEFSALGHAVIITDSNVAPLYLKSFKRRLKKNCDRVDSIVVPAGEKSKSITLADSLWNRLLDLKTDRKSTIIAFGGGVVGDLAGFAAATFARGIDLVQVPTTLLAQVDSSVGGKTAINLPNAKNMVGAFWQPRAVVIDPNLLETLDDANFVSGLAEVVKYGVIMDESFFVFLENHVDQINERDPETLVRIIATSCRLKAEVVGQDERESSGRRAILNYGHTFGHAIEKVYRYGTWLHGQAVAIGMQAAARLAVQMDLCDGELLARQTALLTALNLPLLIEPGKENELIAAMHRDKKVAAGKLRLVLPTRIGDVKLVDAPDDESLVRAWSN